MSKHHSKTSRARLFACAAAPAIALALFATGAAAQSATANFEIPSEPLSQALLQFSQQANIDIVAPADLTRGKTAHAVHGAMTPQEALHQLLAGTGLGVTPGANGGLVLVRGEAGPFATDGEPPTAVQEVVVTGTHIGGGAPVGSLLDVYGRDAIDRSGAATLDEFARTIPNNFAGTDTLTSDNANLSYSSTAGQNGQNLFRGAAFNIYGLGASSTLTLLNGERLAPGGFTGSFADIAQIPASAIERVEVLSDGASAIYGADAVAGVVNMITRHDFDGAESSVRYGGATEGGDSEFTASQLIGKSWDSGNFLVNYEYSDVSGLDASQRNYIGYQGGPSSLIPESRRSSVFATVTENFGPDTEVDATLLYGHRAFTSSASSDYTLFGYDDVTENGGGTDELSATISAKQSLPNQWNLKFTGNYSGSRSSAFSNSDITGSLSETSIQDVDASTSVSSVSGIAQGPLFTTPGGPVKAAFGVDYRQEAYKSSTYSTVTYFGSTFLEPNEGTPRATREVGSLFGEFLIPIVGPENGIPGVRQLQVSAAARFDHYSDFGSSTNPKIGVSWKPAGDLELRATYGTSFQVPLLYQEHQPAVNFTETVPDTTSPTGFTDALFLNGGNPNLQPEKSRSYTGGFSYNPRSIPGLAVVIDYFHIDFTNRIEVPPSSTGGFNTLNDPLLAPYISRNPALATVLSYFNGPGFLGDEAGGGAGNVAAIFDDRLANIGATAESGVNSRIQYSAQVAGGTIALGLNATVLSENKIQTVKGAPEFSLLNIYGEPPKWKGQGSVAWFRGPISFSTVVNYVGAYNNSLITPAPPIGAWTTGDVRVAYNFGERARSVIVRNLTVALNVINITDARPPFVEIPPGLLFGANPIPFDPLNASPVGRVVALTITKRW